MLKRICSVMLSALLLQAAALPAFGATNAEKEAARAEKVRARLAKLGTGRDARVKVELRDKTKLEGYVSASDADTFALTDDRGDTTRVPYQDVKKARGNNLSTGAKVAIGIGIGVGVFIIIALIVVARGGD
jgi:hypothetical protein